MCATTPSPKKLLGRRRVRSMSWSGHDEVPRRYLLAQAAGGVDGYDAFDAEGLEGVDVRARRYFRRQEAVAAAVTRQERDGRVAERAQA